MIQNEKMISLISYSRSYNSWCIYFFRFSMLWSELVVFHSFTFLFYTIAKHFKSIFVSYGQGLFAHFIRLQLKLQSCASTERWLLVSITGKNNFFQMEIYIFSSKVISHKEMSWMNIKLSNSQIFLRVILEIWLKMEPFWNLNNINNIVLRHSWEMTMKN